MAKILLSIFGDTDRCMLTGMNQVERHHVFGGRMGHKSKSEKYRFIAPLYPKAHPNGVHADDRWCRENLGMSLAEIDWMLKQRCQEHYEREVGTREEFMAEFGRNYL